MSAEMSLRDTRRRKEFMLAATLLDMPVFGRGRCRYVQRKAVLSIMSCEFRSIIRK